MGALRIDKISYYGDNYEFESPELNGILSIIEGPNGAGKSTFFNLLYFGLGGKVEEFESSSDTKHEQIVEDKNNYVLLNISISGQPFVFMRKIGDNNITIHEITIDSDVGKNKLLLTLPIFRRETAQRIFSDWILEKLNIPVVEIYQGGKNFKLNFNDLLRLIYHNQSPDPQGIYKPADNSSFLSDSIEVRRAIFQILVGKTLLALYEAVGQLKKSERELTLAKDVLKEYQSIVQEILNEYGFREVTNNVFLQQQINSNQEQLEKLQLARSQRVSTRPSPNEFLSALDIDKRDLGMSSKDLRDLDEKLGGLAREKSKLIEVVNSINLDLERISKVLFTHQNLELFSSDTCPYCLTHVSRVSGHCVCGNKVDENDYQRFFYSTSEYIEIYTSKRKSFETVKMAADDIDNEFKDLSEVRKNLALRILKLENRINTSYELNETQLNDLNIEQYEEKIFEIRDKLNELTQALKMENKIADHQREYEYQKNLTESIRQKVNLLDSAAKEELRARVMEFDKIYNDLMTRVLADCRTASINSDTYLPIINNGTYREASASVPKRFLYYLTLLKMSLTEDIPYPKLLLVDTPETAGIDEENLKRMFEQIRDVKSETEGFQILLSTGIGKYPPEFEHAVVMRVRTDNKLLKRRRQLAS